MELDMRGGTYDLEGVGGGETEIRLYCMTFSIKKESKEVFDETLYINSKLRCIGWAVLQ